MRSRAPAVATELHERPGTGELGRSVTPTRDAEWSAAPATDVAPLTFRQIHTPDFYLSLWHYSTHAAGDCPWVLLVFFSKYPPSGHITTISNKYPMGT